jgi:hypothetical protein
MAAAKKKGCVKKNHGKMCFCNKKLVKLSRCGGKKAATKKGARKAAPCYAKTKTDAIQKMRTANRRRQTARTNAVNSAKWARTQDTPMDGLSRRRRRRHSR